MKKNILFFVYATICFLLLTSYALAYTDISTLPSNVSNKCDSKSCWPFYGSDDTVRGMRISLMKTDGTTVGKTYKTYNVVADYKHYDLLVNYGNYIVLGSNCNKVQYEMGKCNATVETKKDWIGSPWKNGYLGVGSAVSSYFSHLNVNFLNNLKNWRLSEIWKWADTEKLPVSDNRTIKLFNLLFGLSEEEILNIAYDKNPNIKLDDLWVVVEPLTMVRYNYKNYLGTNYELAQLGYNDVMQSHVSSVVGRRMPCSAITIGDIATKYPTAPGVSTSSKTYFDGHLSYINPATEIASHSGVSVNTICSSSKYLFKKGYPDTSKGVGVGIIYFRDLIKTDLNCDKVNSGISNYNEFMNKLESTYQSSGLSGIYALPEVVNGIKYNYNGKTEVADKIWYINQCTCYGVYDTYKKSTGTEIGSLIESRIKTIFTEKSQLFKTYVDQIKEHVKQISNTNPSSVGIVTSWDFEKYKSYNCKIGTSSCEKVDFNDLYEYDVEKKQDCYSSCAHYIHIFWPWYYECYDECDENNEKIDENKQKNNIIEKCKDLPLYKDEKFTTDYIDKNKNLYNSCFKIYNEQKNTNYTIDSYQKEGCVPTSPGDTTEIKKKYNCTPRYNIGTCIDHENIFYNDSSQELNNEEYWEHCVFSDEQAYYDIDTHKWSDHSDENDLTYYDDKISSPYCEVYCTESLTGSFNSETIQVKAGEHFIWNGHSVSGSRTCRTKSIEWDKFIEDLEEWNNKIEKAFNTYLVARDQQASIERYDVDNGCKSCAEYYPDTEKCDENGENCKTIPGKCKSYDYWDKTCIKWNSASYGDGDVAASGEAGSECSCSNYPDKDFIGTKDKDYEYIMNDSKQIYNDMLKCYNADKSSTWVDSSSTDGNQGSSWNQYLYTLDPTAYVKYYYKIDNKEGIYNVGIKQEEEMDKDVKYTAMENQNDCKTYTGGVEVLISCDASTNKCKREYLGIKKCENVQMTKGATVEFSIPDGIYEYINKDNHISFTITDIKQLEQLKQDALQEGKTFNYIYLGYSNFPVEYKTPNGLYGKVYDNGELSITYSDLGHKISGKTTAVDTILESIDRDKYGDWQCQFEVYSKLIPEDKDNDINLIYRPIDLNNPFPDINGQGRETGSNWCIGGSDRANCSNSEDNYIVYDYILNNRDAKGHELYSKEPMYTFILTPAIINEIRRYNDENSYADYYGKYGNDKYDFKCNEGTGRTCISEYLTHIIEITDAEDQPGTCVKPQYRTYNNPDEFDGCRY